MKRFLSIPLAALLLGACGLSANALITDHSNGCVVHNPNPRAGETITWSGGCLNGFAHGPGTVSWYLHGAPNGQFEGGLKNGRMEGPGTAFYPSGNRYVGEFRNGVPNGRGTLSQADGRVIAGEWRDGRRVAYN